MSNEIVTGLLTGITSALLFNPIDKIIFASCIQGKSLFSKEIFSNLFKGSMNNIGTRIITSGLYFTYIDHYASVIENKAILSFYTAFVCGFTNPLQLIKYNSWYHNCSNSVSIRNIYTNHGIRGFAIGFPALVMRDFIFNYIYISNKKKGDHLHNLFVISCALVCTSPVNLVRNFKYSTNESVLNVIKNFKFRQLGIGITICRSCLCFYSSQVIYDFIKLYL